jgi:hypothetical protein
LTAPAASPRAALLAEAQALVCGARNVVYGPPADSFARAAAFAALATGHRLTPRDVVHVMRAVKQARLRQSPEHWDTMVDMAGYDALLAEVSGDWGATVAALAGIGGGEAPDPRQETLL